MNLPDDQTMDAVLANPEFRTALGQALTNAGIETPIDDIEREELRFYVGQALAGIEAAQGAVTGEDEQADAIPDKFLDDALAEPQLRETMEAILKDNGIDEPISDVPRNLLKRLLFQLVEHADAERKRNGGGVSGGGAGSPN